MAKQCSTVDLQSDEKRVVIETFRWSNAIPKAEGSNESSDFPVLLRAAAPRRRVDLVVIPNLGKKDHDGILGKMIREAMASMVKCLHQDDRLSLKGDGGGYEGLIDKASGNLEKMIDIKLTAREITLGIELKAACKVLEERSPEESKSRLGLIVLLSAGHWVELGEPTAESRSKFPVYRILLTKDSATSMLHIAAGNRSGGAHVCSVQDMEIPEMEERVKAFLQEAMSPAAATAVRIDMATFGGVAISSIMSDDGRERDTGKNKIDVGILCEGEDKKFVVNLRVPKEMHETPWGIMEVSGCYKDAADEVTGGGVQIEPSQVFLRTKLCPPEYMEWM